MTRRISTLSFTFFYAIISIFLFLHPSFAAEEESSSDEIVFPMGFSRDGLKKLTDQVTRTGVGMDAIPPLFRPQFVNVSDASLSMDDGEVVFIVHYPEGPIRIYPQRIMVWHEVVNDVLPDKLGGTQPVPGVAESSGTSYTIAYSPLSGTVIAFRSLAGKYPSTFGSTGDLLNANTVMYDRISGSIWSQLLALCIDGPLIGKRLDRVQVNWATWGKAKHIYNGKAEVLSRSTGYNRPYGKDPYGSYQIKGTYYDDTQIVYPISYLDSRLPPKKRVLGLEQDALFAAVQVDAVKESLLINFTMGIIPMVALYDPEIDTVRIFDRRLDGNEKERLDFRIRDSFVTDEATKSQWTPDGECVYGRFLGKKLTPVYTMDAMWFAWAAFHKGSLIFPPPAQN